MHGLVGAGTAAAGQTPADAPGHTQPQASRSGSAAGKTSGVEPDVCGSSSTANVDDCSAVDTKQLLEQLRTFHDLVSAAAGTVPQEYQTAYTGGHATPQRPPSRQPTTMADTPLYGAGTAPDETPQPVGHASMSTPAFTVQPSTPPTAAHSAGPWEGTPEARAVLQGQRALMAQLQRLLDNPGALQAPGASLKELQGSLLQATATLQHSRALHNIQGVLGDARRLETPPASRCQTQSDGEHLHGLPEETPNGAGPIGDTSTRQQDEQQPLEDFQQVVSSSRRMQSLLSDRLSSSKKSKEASSDWSDWSDMKPAPAAHSNGMHADGASSAARAALQRSSDDGGSAAGKEISSHQFHARTGMEEPGQRLHDRRSSWHQMTESHADPLSAHSTQRRSRSTADEAACAAARSDAVQGASEETEALAGITREVNRLLRSPGKPPSRRWSVEHAAGGHTLPEDSKQTTPVHASAAGRPGSASSASGKARPPRQAGSRTAPLSAGARGSPDMNVHCNPLFGAEDPPQAAAQEGNSASSKGGLGAQSGHDSADGRLMEQSSTSRAGDTRDRVLLLPDAQPKGPQVILNLVHVCKSPQHAHHICLHYVKRGLL